jgi:hypothetical protein
VLTAIIVAQAIGLAGTLLFLAASGEALPPGAALGWAFAACAAIRSARFSWSASLSPSARSC